jgi:hypothetical protein
MGEIRFIGFDSAGGRPAVDHAVPLANAKVSGYFLTRDRTG